MFGRVDKLKPLVYILIMWLNNIEMNYMFGLINDNHKEEKKKINFAI